MNESDKTDLEQLSTKEKLLRVGITLFSKYGFERTTARMIAQAAEVNVATMPFHFGDKENYYAAVLNYVAESISEDYRPFREEVDQMRMNGPLSPPLAWKYIEHYIDFILEIVKKRDPKILFLLIREQDMPPHGDFPITKVLCRDSESILQELLVDYWAANDRKSAIIAARLATASLISLAEHPLFIRRALSLPDDTPADDSSMEDVYAIARRCILCQLRYFTPDSHL